MKRLLIDGYPLTEPRKGLSVVTAKLASELTRSLGREAVLLALPSTVELHEAALDPAVAVWNVPHSGVRPNYIDKLLWTRSLARLQKARVDSTVLFTYPNNAGELNRNLVIIPDLMEEADRAFGSLMARWQRKVRFAFSDAERKRAYRARWIITHSEYVAAQLRRVVPVAKDRIKVIPIAQQDGVGPMPIAKADDVCARGGIPQKEKFILYVGGYAARKNFPMLLRICARLAARFPHFRCYFVGGLNCADVCEAAKSCRGIRPLAVVPAELLTALYHLCEFTVYPSLEEGFGLPIVEAGSCGKLCICGDNSSQVEVQPNPKYRVAANDELLWEERISYFWGDPSASAAAGRECRLNAERFSWSRTVAGISELLSGAC